MQNAEEKPIEVNTSSPAISMTPDQIMSNIRELITALVGLGIIFTATGFVVISSHLRAYTSIRTFDVHPTHYIVSGVVVSAYYLSLMLIMSWIAVGFC